MDNTLRRNPTEPTYTFLSIATPKPGMLDELVRIATAPSTAMLGEVPGMVARQVAVDTHRSTVMVWVTLDSQATLYDYLQSPAGQRDHTGGADLESIIETFEMYDLQPVATNL